MWWTRWNAMMRFPSRLSAAAAKAKRDMEHLLRRLADLDSPGAKARPLAHDPINANHSTT